MSVMNESFKPFDFLQENHLFLETLLAKAKPYAPEPAVIDELYGLVSPLKVRFLTDQETDSEETAILRQWGVAGIMRLESDWDNLYLKLFFTGSRFYTYELTLFERKYRFLPTQPLNLELFGQIQKYAGRCLTLLRESYGNSLLRMIGLRERLQTILAQLPRKEMKSAALEIMVKLMNVNLEPEEKFNQDLFFKRAQIVMAEILAWRAEFYGMGLEGKRFAACAASRKSHLIFDELYEAVCLIWGCLANVDYSSRRNTNEGRYYFTEIYHPNGKIEIGEISPAIPGDCSEMKLCFGRDWYKQVFPDYETAFHFRSAALRMLNLLK